MAKKKKIKEKISDEEKKEKETSEEKGKQKIIIENEKPLEERIETSEEEINENEFEEFFEQSELPKTSPSLRRINAPQRIPARLEENLIQSTNFNKDEKEDENSFKYDLRDEKTGKEGKYSIISQEYSAIQKETLKHNPHILMKEQSFIDLNQKNIVENFPRTNLNALAEETLKNPENRDDKYTSKFTFREKERKPHNPFEKKEINYNKFEQ